MVAEHLLSLAATYDYDQVSWLSPHSLDHPDVDPSRQPEIYDRANETDDACDPHLKKQCIHKMINAILENEIL